MEEMNKRNIAAFDFDGTLTTRDSFLAFIKFACGTVSYYAGLVRYAPQLALMLLHLYPNSKAKQRLFSHFFKGWQYSWFKALGEDFTVVIDTMRNEPVIQRLQEHIDRGDTVYIVSASLPEWITPWCSKLGVKHVLATEVEVDDDGRLTGRFKTPNCRGQEKVNRLLAVEPDRQNYHLTAYGDSRGDRELLALADQSIKASQLSGRVQESLTHSTSSRR